MKNTILAIIGIALLVFGGVFGAVAFSKETVKEVPTEVEVEKIVEVEKLVDNGNLAILEQYIFDHDGNLTELEADDLDEDEMSLLIERINFLKDLKIKALEEVKKELFDEVDGKKVGKVKLEEDELERLKLDDEDDEVIVSDIDFEDKDAIVTVKGTFEQDDEEYEFEVEVEFKDGVIKGLEVTSLV